MLELKDVVRKIDVDGFNACHAFIRNNRELLTDFPPNINKFNEIEMMGSEIYFDRLTKALRILNEMVHLLNDDGMIGIELSTPDNTVAVFADTLDPQWVSKCATINFHYHFNIAKSNNFSTIPFKQYQQFSMSELCQFDTQLHFITETDQNSEILDVNRNRYSALFHLTFTLAMNVSLIVLNNSIIGMPHDELQKLIFWLNARDGVDNKQIIVVQRSDVNSLSTNVFHLIHCPADDLAAAENFSQ